MHNADSATTSHRAKADTTNLDAYKARVAEPVMRAIDGLPIEFRELARPRSGPAACSGWS